jgi:hypothetical protein
MNDSTRHLLTELLDMIDRTRVGVDWRTNELNLLRFLDMRDRVESELFKDRLEQIGKGGDDDNDQ